MSVYDRIKTKLELLREKDKDFTLSGSKWHKYQMGPPLTESQISEFESKYEIQLPEDFRGLFLEMGNGGISHRNHAAGPYSGIYDLWNEEYVIYHDFRKSGDTSRFLASPCPLKKAIDSVHERTGRNFMTREDRDNFWYLRNTDQAFRDEFDACMSQFDYDDLRRGTLEICEYGCGMAFLLVVTGEERGTVWVDDMYSGANGILPLGVDFITWYENWLDNSMRRVETPRSERRVWGYFEYGDTAKVDFKQS